MVSKLGVVAVVVVCNTVRRKMVHTVPLEDGVPTTIEFSHDGKTLASGDTNSVILVDLATKQTKVLRGHTGWVIHLAFSPDNKTLATSSADRTIKLWNIDTGKEAMTLRGHTQGIHSMAF